MLFAVHVANVLAGEVDAAFKRVIPPVDDEYCFIDADIPFGGHFDEPNPDIIRSYDATLPGRTGKPNRDQDATDDDDDAIYLRMFSGRKDMFDQMITI